MSSVWMVLGDRRFEVDEGTPEHKGLLAQGFLPDGVAAFPELDESGLEDPPGTPAGTPGGAGQTDPAGDGDGTGSGGADDDGLEDLTVAELKELATGEGIEVPSSAKKDDIVALIREELAKD